MNEELKKEAIEMLDSDDELFVEMVDELDNYSGFADGYRAYSMYELEDFFGGIKLSDFLAKITASFNFHDDYFFFNIYGVDSTDDKVDLYRSYTDSSEVLDEIINHYPNIAIYNREFGELIEQIIDEVVEE